MAFWITQYIKSFGFNFGEVVPNHIYRSAQPDHNDLWRLRTKYGVLININLRDDIKDEERQEVEATGMRFLNIPMPDNKTPDIQKIKLAIDTMRYSGKNTLINCKGGRHRTGLVCAVFRVVVQGWPKEEAWKEAEKYGFYSALGHQPLEDWFKSFKIEDFK